MAFFDLHTQNINKIFPFPCTHRVRLLYTQFVLNKTLLLRWELWVVSVSWRLCPSDLSVSAVSAVSTHLTLHWLDSVILHQVTLSEAAHQIYILHCELLLKLWDVRRLPECCAASPDCMTSCGRPGACTVATVMLVPVSVGQQPPGQRHGKHVAGLIIRQCGHIVMCSQSQVKVSTCMYSSFWKVLSRIVWH